MDVYLSSHKTQEHVTLPEGTECTKVLATGPTADDMYQGCDRRSLKANSPPDNQFVFIFFVCVALSPPRPPSHPQHQALRIILGPQAAIDLDNKRSSLDDYALPPQPVRQPLLSLNCHPAVLLCSEVSQ